MFADSMTRLPASIGVTILLLSCVLLYAGCGQPQSTSTPTTMTTSAPLGDYYLTGPVSIEESIVWSDVVARIRMRSATGAVEYGPSAPGSDRSVHTATLEFKFEVLEYLKGSGGTEIIAVVRDTTGYNTDAEASAVLPGMVASRDTRWDDREAIVFLDDVYKQKGRYLLGYVTMFGEDAYTVASPYYREWLPDARSSTAGSGSNDQRFLLDDPAKLSSAGGSGQSGARSATTTVATTTITLSALKTRIGDLKKEVDAGDGSREYMECVLEKYEEERQIRWKIENKGTAVRRYDYNIGSGQPSRTVVYEDRTGEGLVPDKAGRYWLEGEDKDLFTVGTFNYVPFTFAGNGPHDRIRYTRRISTVRPLPAGKYRFFFNGMWAGRLLCNAYSELERNLDDNFVAVTAPDGVLHEAFFDPASLGASIGGSSGMVGFSADGGVLKPAAFSVNNSTTTISELRWSNGSVVMTLKPYVSLSGYALKIIEMDGSVSLTLKTNDATTVGSNKRLTWSVPKQPWHAGDKLMLRIEVVP